MKTKRNYTQEEKRNAVEVYRNSNGRLMDVSRELGIPQSTISCWHNTMMKKESTLEQNRAKTEKARAARLAKHYAEKQIDHSGEIAQLREENKKLKSFLKTFLFGEV